LFFFFFFFFWHSNLVFSLHYAVADGVGGWLLIQVKRDSMQVSV